jgi:hypothetical protein
MSKPNGIPQRIIAKSLHQASPQWVSDDIASHYYQLVLPPQGPVMKSLLPKADFITQAQIYSFGTQ